MGLSLGVIGLGSMGKRRVRDLRGLGYDVIGFDVRPDRREEASALHKIRTVDRFEDLLEAAVGLCVIATPPDQHQGYYERCFRARLPFFSEANIFTPAAEWFAEREAQSGVKTYPSATPRFYPLFHTMREALTSIGPGNVCSVFNHYGGYLPFWHPWESYEEFYAGRPETSAAREMVPFEIDWLCWIFGPIKAVSAVRDKRSEWVTGIDDTYMVLLEFESGLKGALLIEVHQVAPFRIARVSCRRDSLVLDASAHELRWYHLPSDTWRSIKPASQRTLSTFNFEDVYLSEMSCVMQAFQGTGTYPKTWADARHHSNFLVAAEESWRRLEWVSLAEADSLYDGILWPKLRS